MGLVNAGGRCRAIKLRLFLIILSPHRCSTLAPDKTGIVTVRRGRNAKTSFLFIPFQAFSQSGKKSFRCESRYAFVALAVIHSR